MDRAFGFIVDNNPTWQEMAEAFGWPPRYTRRIIMAIRDQWSTERDNLICEPQGANLPWRYRFADSLTEIGWYHANRMRDAERRLRTAANIVQSIANGHDARTREGKAARSIHRKLAFVREETADLVAVLDDGRAPALVLDPD